MKIDQTYALNEIIQRQDTKNKTQNEEFFSTFDKTVLAKKSEVKSQIKEITDADVDTFLHQLTSLGASLFWLNFNLEKIQDKIDKKRQEFIEQLGINDKTKNLSDEDKKSALEELDKMLEEYIKNLLKQMQDKSTLEKSSQDNPLNQIFGKNNPLNI